MLEIVLERFECILAKTKRLFGRQALIIPGNERGWRDYAKARRENGNVQESGGVGVRAQKLAQNAKLRSIVAFERRKWVWIGALALGAGKKQE